MFYYAFDQSDSIFFVEKILGTALYFFSKIGRDVQAALSFCPPRWYQKFLLILIIILDKSYLRL